MPRIRKKTSKRGTTRQRARFQHKATESRKKKRKEAKKNPQWKSKHKKDPGIPNNFPYKDQILAEVAEERRRAAEEKQRRKEEKQAVANGTTEAGPRREGSGDAFEDIPTISHGTITSAGAQTKSTATVNSNQPGEDSPILVHHDYPHLKSVLERADVVLHVLDARDPLSFRSADVERLVNAHPAKKILFVLNKIDTCPRETVGAWATHLRLQHPTLLFKSASMFLPAADDVLFKPKEKTKAKTDDALGADSIIECLDQWAQEKESDDPLVVAVVGLVNSGKSALINSLLRKSVLPLYKRSLSSVNPTTTTLPQQVTIEAACGKRIQIIDTPGLSWSKASTATLPDTDATSIRARDILLRNKGRIDRLKDPTSAIECIVSRADTQDLMLLYNLPSFEKNNAQAFLTCLSRSRLLVGKRGALDLVGAARMVLQDWGTGKFPWYTTPSSTAAASSFTPVPAPQPEQPYLTQLYSKDESILSVLPTRRELRRRETGLIKFVTPDAVDTRCLALDEPWLARDVSESGDDHHEGDSVNDAEDEHEVSDDDDGCSVADTEGEDVEDDNVHSETSVSEESSDEEDEETSEIEETPPEPSGQHKRKRATGNIPQSRTTKRMALPQHHQTKSAIATSKQKIRQKLIKPKSSSVAGQKATAKRESDHAHFSTKKHIANIPTKIKHPTTSQENEDAYDFAQFFGGGKLP